MEVATAPNAKGLPGAGVNWAFAVTATSRKAEPRRLTANLLGIATQAFQFITNSFFAPRGKIPNDTDYIDHASAEL